MISKIIKLKNFGVFRDFTWKNELPEFKKFNLIYGWNRSGKTTISRSFSACERKTVYDCDKNKQYPENGEFEIKTDDGKMIKSSEIKDNVLPVKVFNQDFIDDNVSFNPSNSCNPIIYISEEDIESKKQLDKLRLNRVSFYKNYDDSKKAKISKEEIKTVFLKSLGVTISNVVFDKTYNRTKAENKIKEVGVENFTNKTLSDADKKKYEDISKSEAGKKQELFPNFQVNFIFNDEKIIGFEKIFSVAKMLLNKKIVSETLERLKDDQGLSNWVKQGFDLHKTKEEKEKCLFCQKSLDQNFLSSLSKHFSKDYDDLQNKIISFVDEIKKLKKEKIDLQQSNGYYPDLRNRFEEQAKDMNSCIQDLNNWIEEIIVKLQEKFNNPLADFDFNKEPKTQKHDYKNEFNKAINGVFSKFEDPFGLTSQQNIENEYFELVYNEITKEINAVVAEHNAKANNHVQEVKIAKEKLELHSIATALAVQDYKKIEDELTATQIQETQTKTVLGNCDKDIVELEQKSSNIGEAIKKINNHLTEFFGREEIQLALDTDKKGYTITRDNRPANNLSEGEKTAIAFSYFIVKVKENDFQIKDGIIFIDDPISSFDSNFIYHCFSLINNHFKEAKQLFISTHNFQLFNLVKNWYINKNKKVDSENKKQQGATKKPFPCEFYMVENFFEAGIRTARITLLDRTLRDFKSEYHFLFSLLNKFKNEGGDYADFYTIGNVARRFFDIFADFKIPNSKDQKQKLDTIISEINKVDEKVSSIDKDKVYKIINEFSHNSDPTSAIEHKDRAESQNAIEILLKIIKESDPTHFDILEKSLPVNAKPPFNSVTPDTIQLEQKVYS